MISSVKNKFKNWPILAQILPILTAAIVIVGFLSGIFIYDLEREYLLKNLELQSQKTFNLLSAVSIDAVITEDLPLLETMVTQSVKNDPQILSLIIENEEGIVLAEWKNSKKNANISPLEFFQSLVFEGETFGKMTLVWNVEPLYQEIEAHVGNVRLLTAGILLLLAVLILLLVNWLALHPIRKINKRLILLAEGDYTTGINISTSRELNRLAESVITLSETLALKKQHEAKLSERSARIRAILNANVDGIITVDEAGIIESFNPAAEKIFGYSKDEAIKQNISILMPSQYKEKPIHYLRNYLNISKKKVTGIVNEVIGRRKDGSTFPLDISVSEVVYGNNRLLTGIVRDITERKQANEKLQEAYTAGIAENAIGVLHNIGNAITPTVVNNELLISHQNKLHLIIDYLRKFHQLFVEHHQSGKLDLFLSEDDKGKRMLPFLSQLADQLETHIGEENEMLESTNKQLKHISNVISLQQKYANIQPFQQKFQVPVLIQDVLGMMQAAFKERNIEIVNDISSDLPEITSDKSKLVQVLMNLLKNSVESIEEQLKHSPEKHPQIQIKIVAQNSNFISFSIHDSGIGADSDKLKSVFDFGYSTKERGAGFGLHDCSNFIHSNNGKLSIKSPGIGLGATVEFTLPVSPQGYEKELNKLERNYR